MKFPVVLKLRGGSSYESDTSYVPSESMSPPSGNSGAESSDVIMIEDSDNDSDNDSDVMIIDPPSDGAGPEDVDDGEGDNHDSDQESSSDDETPFCRTPAVRFDEALDQPRLFEYWRSLPGPRPVPALSEMHKHFQFTLLGGVAAGRYLCWEITDQEFWHAANLQQPFIRFVHDQGIEGTLQVYADLRHGGPIGGYFGMMAVDRRRVRGFMVQLYGIPNEVPCRSCETHFRSFDSTDHAGMWPFFGCRSIPGEFNGICGNCYFSITDSTCLFRDPRYAHLRARGDRDPPLVEDITADNSPFTDVLTLVDSDDDEEEEV
ncbi:hypothetical protein F4776DRAFT_598284 [Hypoxylon sp. NC0597]|nr:hypothetical protein F4776DRAFT_598284 [Hypoxylon sp. NC0597]